MKSKIFYSFLIALLFSFFGILNDSYLFFNYESLDGLFNDLYFLFFSNGGSTFQWLSYYVFPNLKLKTAFIIGQIIYVPFLALLILSMIILFHFVFKRLYQIKSKKD